MCNSKMTTPYFILTSDTDKNVMDVSSDQFIIMRNKLVHLLPHVNVDYYMKHGLFESNIIEWCKQLCSSDKNTLDIGAHSGTYALNLSDCSKNVYAFEPQRATYYSLCGGVCLSGKQNVECIQYGLGSLEQCGVKELSIVSQDGGGSTLHPTSRVLRTENIEIRTLDSFHLDNIGFIKMDVEENELYVLQGGVDTLRRSNFPKILFESNHENQPLFDFIRDLNYKIVPLQGYRNMFLAEQ